MRKITAFLLAALFAFAFAGCGSSEVKIDYGSSELYTKEDMDAAIAVIKREFSTWHGCELHRIYYVSDEKSITDTLEWMNKLADANGLTEEMTQCIMFESDFHSPRHGGGAWNPDQEYTRWQWWLARSNDGKWQLLTWGYG